MTFSLPSHWEQGCHLAKNEIFIQVVPVLVVTLGNQLEATFTLRLDRNANNVLKM